MKNEDVEKEMEERVEREIAKREFLSDVRKASVNAISEGYLSARDLVAILTEFTVQGYIVAHGSGEDGKSFFDNSMQESWDACLKEYKKEKKDKKEMHIDDDQLQTIKDIVKQLIKQINDE